MKHSTTNTYALKREIISFSNRLSLSLPKPVRKFSADMTYGILASSSCLLTDIADSLHEKSKKINSVDRLSKHLASGIPDRMLHNYLRLIQQTAPENPVIHIDDSDVVKPDGHHFEALGYVRDGSESTSDKNVFKKGYLVTEACVLDRNSNPVSIFSKVHSSAEKHFSSVNDATFAAIDRGVSLFHKATFVMDRGYDDNKVFHKLFHSGQDFVIRLTTKRKVLFHSRWFPVMQLCDRRKGKIRMPLTYKGKRRDAYLSHVKVQVTAARKYIYLVLIYGITEHPMMLATNKEIRSKEDVLAVAKTYFSRWRIEEYFRAKKQLFGFENFRVRKLTAINSLNFFLSAAMAFLARTSGKPETNALKAAIIRSAAPVREKVSFRYYRIAKGIAGILSYADEGVRLWFKPKRLKYRQLCLRLIC